MLTDFFRINLPYGIRRNSNNEWTCFNREYMPLGWKTQVSVSIHDENHYANLPIYTSYKGLTEAKLEKLAIEPDAIRRDDNGKINMVFFYKDATNPQSSPQHWDMYFEKIKQLSKCEVKRQVAF